MSIASQPENAAICNASPEHWVVVNGWLTMGGAERQSLRLAEVLLKQGHQVTFIGLANPGIVQDECARLGIPCHYWPLQMVGRPRRRILADLWRFLRFIRSLRPTYLAPYCMPPNVACGVIWRWTGARACVWQQRDEGRHFQPKTLERLALRWTPAFISNSSHARQWVTDNGVDPAKISVVMNGTDLPDLNVGTRGAWRATHGISLERLVVSMVANLHEYKDHMTLVRAWAQVVSNGGPRPLLVLAGGHQSAYPAIKEYVQANALEDCVLCPGVVRDVAALLKDTDLIAFSSLTEGCPNGVLEGMAAGLAVVGTDIPALREAVGPSGIPYLVPPEDVDALASRLQLLIGDETLRKSLGPANRCRIAKEFSIAQMASKTRSVFEAVAAGH